MGEIMAKDPKQPTKTISRKLRQLREAAGLTQAELAAKAGLNIGTYTKIEYAQQPNVLWSTIVALADALGVSLDEFREPGDSSGRKSKR